MVLMDRNEDEVLAAIESGVLSWAWDIASQRSQRREIRIWRDSLLKVLESRPSIAADESTVLRSIFPPRPIRTTELQRIFSCSSSHVSHLIEEGSLVAPARERHSGPLSITRVDPANLERFLLGRRIL